LYIRSLDITDLRGFEHAHLDFVYPGREQGEEFAWSPSWPAALPNVNLLLGINGAGKTTVLSAIPLAILSPILPESGFRSFFLVSRRPKKDRALLRYDLQFQAQDQSDAIKKAGLLTSVKNLQSQIVRQGDYEKIQEVVQEGEDELPKGEFNVISAFGEMYKDRSPAFFMVGYGATRRVESLASYRLDIRRRDRSMRYARVAGLFEDFYSLVPLAAFLPLLSKERPEVFGEVVELLRQLMPDQLNFTGKEHSSGDYLFSHRGLEVPFPALSDGHRAYLGWISDLLYHLTECCPEGGKLSSLVGIVLVDEIDLHIHPAWQLEIIPRVASAFPSLQFIFTSHSSLVAGTLEKPNLYVVLQEDARKGSKLPPAPKIVRPPVEVHGLSADQILTSELFGLESTRDPGFVEELEEVSQRATRGEEGAALELMRKLAHGKAGSPVREAPEWVKKLAQERRK